MNRNLILGIGIFFLLVTGCTREAKAEHFSKEKLSQEQLDGYAKAYFASGCFWCVEAIFESLEGVKEVVSGYAGGTARTANYRKVCSGMTLHAEAVEVYYDPEKISYQTLLKVFYGSHDPTTMNSQGPDSGPQYRSVIYFQNEEEKKWAEGYTAELTEENIFSAEIVTEIVPFNDFFKAEEYHQDYERNHPNQPYVKGVSIPRLNKFKAKFPELLKKNH